MTFLGESSDWMAAVFSADGALSSISAQAEGTTGYSAAELVAGPVTLILADQSAFDLPQMMQSARELGYWEGVVLYQHRNGRAIGANSCLMALSGRETEDERFLLLSFLNGPLPGGRLNHCLREVGSRLRVTAHQLNNPLAIVMGFAQLVLMQLPQEGGLRSDMERLYSEAQRLTQLVEELHTYALTLQGENEPAYDGETH
jgi:signal transduction histidine kinase